jgi:NAD(P)-dependent dehydrogenase (short-subunit alcohol dehydrogenase family)
MAEGTDGSGAGGAAAGLLAGKVACITGASAGLGRAMVEVFAAAGARVVGTARRGELGADLQAAVEAAGGEMVFVPADLRRVEDCERFVQTAVDTYGGVDILVNNAAARPDPPLLAIHETDERNWDDVTDINLKAAFFCTKYALAPMRAAGSGHIINIASFTAVEATAGMAIYCSSKAGLVQLTRVTAVEYGCDGIRANAIILGGTNTGQGARTAGAQASFSAARPYATGGMASRPLDLPPPRRQGSMESADVARALVMLSADDSALVTGASIAIDGGVSAGLLTSQWTHMQIAASAAQLS